MSDTTIREDGKELRALDAENEVRRLRHQAGMAGRTRTLERVVWIILLALAAVVGIRASVLGLGVVGVSAVAASLHGPELPNTGTNDAMLVPTVTAQRAS